MNQAAMWICALDAGEAQLSYAPTLSVESRDDLIEWLELVLSVLKKRRDAHRADDAVASKTGGFTG